MGEEMREYFFVYVVEYDALTQTEYARIFYFIVNSGVLYPSALIHTTTLYLMIF